MISNVSLKTLESERRRAGLVCPVMQVTSFYKQGCRTPGTGRVRSATLLWRKYQSEQDDMSNRCPATITKCCVVIPFSSHDDFGLRFANVPDERQLAVRRLSPATTH